MLKPYKLNSKNFLSNADLTKKETLHIFELAQSFKNKTQKVYYENKVLGLIFDKSSTRTRVSFQVAMSRIGGTTIDLNPNTSQIGRGEPIRDTARVLSRYCDVLAIRTFKQDIIEEYAKWSSKPVINALTDFEHPCQALADFFTIKEEFGGFENLTLTFIGDSNNVANSLILCASLLGINIRIACPKGYEPKSAILKKINQTGMYSSLEVFNDPYQAAKGSHILYTDVWASMGEENDKEVKDAKFKGFTIDNNLINEADEDAIVLHCLPAYRDKEITDDVMESEKSRIFQQAENRMHVQQALLTCFLS